MGAMGAVYRAQHVQSGLEAALKTVHVPRQGILPMLRREIQALARLRHPGIVRILDSGTENGMPWYAMELIQGMTLREFARAAWSPASPAPNNGGLLRLLSVFRRASSALAYIHGEGLIHRDLKPDNILVAKDDRPVLVDFGLRVEFAGADTRESLSGVIEAGGTLQYMAPEHMRGEMLDARSDLYSLGCMFYELLTGRLPFSGDSVAEIIRGHLEERPQLPSRLSPALPRELDDLIMSLLRKEPRQRTGYASDVAAAFNALGAADWDTATVPPIRPYLYRPALVGRAAALSTFERLLVDITAGRGRVVAVAGESGVGKTRLGIEFAREAQAHQVQVLTGECFPISVKELAEQTGGGRPLEALRRALRAVADRCREHGLGETERLLGRRGKILAPYEPALNGLPGQDHHPDPADLPPPAARHRVLTALADTFAALAQHAPLVIILDDLQWADDLTLRFVNHVQRSGCFSRSRLLFVVTYRTEEVAGLVRDFLESPGLEVMELDRLSSRDVGQMVGDMLSLATPPQGFVDFLYAHSEGNPFFVAEYMQSAMNEGVLMRDAQGRWHVVAGEGGFDDSVVYSSLPVPRSMQELVQQRLNALPERALMMAYIAAVAGRETSLALLSHIASMDEEELMELADELVRHHVFRQTGSGRIRFAHDKIREAAYAAIPEPLLRKLHKATARAIERLFGPRNEEYVGQLAYHWEKAGVLDLARSHYLEAAREAARSYAHVESERMYRAFLELVGEPSSDSVTARNEYGKNVLCIQGRFPEAMDQHRIALQEARTLGDRAGEGVSLQGLAGASYLAGQLGDAERLARQALAIHRVLGDRLSEGFSLSTLGAIAGVQGHTEEARERYQSALDMFRETGDRRAEGVALANLAITYSEHGETARAITLNEEALAIHREVRDTRAEGITMLNLAMDRRSEGHLAQAHDLLLRALLTHEEVGNRPWEGITLFCIASNHLGLGRVEEARTVLRRSLEVFREMGNPRVELVALADLAHIERLAYGNFPGAERYLKRAARLLPAVSDAPSLIPYHCELGHLWMACGKSALQMLAHVRAKVAEIPLSDASELAQDVRRFESAVDAFERGTALFRGDLPRFLPDGLRRWLRQRGDLPAALS
ncbi:MAG: protein kinase [Candidatus Schekmanbacteria bacterium]|nr:protein kinase [Candidatus Schekmanbacteria bacterium]